MWDSSIAECGLLKLGKVTDFQAHQIEHQLGAYTDCNHGQGLAIIHPKLYMHIYKENILKFARFAREVWKVESKDLSEEEIDDILYDIDGCDVVGELLNYYYSLNMIKRFNWLCCYNQINDIHDSNVGYINNRLVIIDYAGYGVL